MPVQSINKTIDGHDVKIVQFYAIRGIKLKAKVFKLLLPVLSPLIGAADVSKGNVKDAMVDGLIDLQKVLPAAIQKLAETLQPEEFFRLIIELLSSTFVDGQEVSEQRFDDLFIANYMFAYKLVYEVILANNFFALDAIGSLSLSSPTAVASPKSEQS